MIVMGFADNYGNDNDLSADAIDAIKTYIDDGKSVLMTHDCMSYRENGTGKKQLVHMRNLIMLPSS